MKNIGQIQSAKKPAKDKICPADQHSYPGSQMSWGEIHASQHIQQNNRIADEIVYFHGDSPLPYSIRNGNFFQTTSESCVFEGSLQNFPQLLRGEQYGRNCPVH